MRVSISLGGSLLTREEGPEPYQRYARVLKELKGMGHSLVVVCGGGRPAREYIRLGKTLGASETLQDRLGILATHLNALLLISALGDEADTRVYKRGSEIRRHMGDKILVGGGYLPGSSTDYRTVLLAEAFDASLIVNATDYGGVFDKDPSRHPDAQQIPRLTYNWLEAIVKERFQQAPGDYGLFDLKAVRRGRRSGIPLLIIDGRDPREIIRAVEGGHTGTLVQDG